MAFLKLGVVLQLIVVCFGNSQFSLSSDTQILVGQNLSLSCIYPEAVSLWWKKVGEPLASTAIQMSGVGNWSSVLKIPKVDAEDSGEYLCLANITDGPTKTSDSVSVAVLGQPTICEVWQNGERIADDRISGSTYTVDKGDNVALECCYTGSDLSSTTLQWKDGDDELVVANGSILLENTLLTFSKITTDSVNYYVCIVGGGLAESDQILLKVQDLDATVVPPGSVTVSADSDVVCASPGGNVSLSCTVGGAYSQLNWLFNNEVVGHGKQSLPLLITDVQESDAGTYVCRVIFQNQGESDFVDAHVMLDLKCIQMVTIETVSRVVAVGNNFVLECTWDMPEGASPAISVTWNTSLLDDDRTSYSGAFNQFLHISESKQSDSGIFVCTVGGPMITPISSSAFISVEAAPNVSIYPSSPLAKRGHRLSLHCVSTSSRAPVFTWKKNSDELSSDPPLSIHSDNATSNISIEKFDDKFLGNFLCTAYDSVHGSVNASVEVKLSTEIYLRSPLESQTVLEGTSLNVSCPIDGGVGNMIVEWRKDNLILESSLGVTVSTELNSSLGPTIKFDRLSVSHEGNYSCHVKDSQQSKTFSFVITVYIPGEFLSTPPGIVTVVKGRDVQFDCVVKGKPLPSVGWTKNLEPITSDIRIRDVENGSLIISQVRESDAALYICLFQIIMSGGVEFYQFELRVVTRTSSSPTQSSTPGVIFGLDINTFLVIVLGAVAGVFLLLTLVVVCGLVCCLWQRKSRPSSANKVALETTSFERRPSMRGSIRKDNSGILVQSSSNLSNLWTLNNDRQDNQIAMRSMGSGSMVVSPGPPIPSPIPPGPTGSLVTMEISPAPKDFPNFPRNNIELGVTMGEGEFGPVVRAIARRIVPGEECTPVAVKMLVTHEGEEPFQANLILMDFVNQMKLSSPYIATILGFCTDQEPFYIIYQYLDKGDLKKFLMGSRPSPTQPLLLTQKELLQVVLQVSEGMAYLYSQQIIHGDLATRNCLISSSLAVKIADLGIGHDLYPGDYYDNGTQLLPIRWMAPELLLDSLQGPSFSLASDVWSFGVFCWEVFSYARQPYDQLSNAQVLRLVPTGHTLTAPTEGCPPLLFSLMQDCWAPSPMQRPSFSQISSTISSVEFD